MVKIGDEVFVTEDAESANAAAKTKEDDGRYMYCQPRYDVDRHVFVLIKTRRRGA